MTTKSYIDFVFYSFLPKAFNSYSSNIPSEFIFPVFPHLTKNLKNTKMKLKLSQQRTYKFHHNILLEDFILLTC